jgi:hypothetical protein
VLFLAAAHEESRKELDPIAEIKMWRLNPRLFKGNAGVRLTGTDPKKLPIKSTYTKTAFKKRR